MVERTLLARLSLLLPPQTTMTLNDAIVNSIAAEPAGVQQERARIVRKQDSLKIAHAILRALSLTSGEW